MGLLGVVAAMMGMAKGWGLLVGPDPLLELRVHYIRVLGANPAGCSALLLWEGAPRALCRGDQGMVEQQGLALPTVLDMLQRRQ